MGLLSSTYHVHKHAAPYPQTIHEHRAPTEESVRLLSAMEKAAEEKVIFVGNVEVTNFGGCLIKLNGKDVMHSFREPEPSSDFDPMVKAKRMELFHTELCKALSSFIFVTEIYPIIRRSN